eukprot:1154519-Pelagomonas_calceolata.AAC.1
MMMSPGLGTGELPSTIASTPASGTASSTTAYLFVHVCTGCTCEDVPRVPVLGPTFSAIDASSKEFSTKDLAGPGCHHVWCREVLGSTFSAIDASSVHQRVLRT